MEAALNILYGGKFSWGDVKLPTANEVAEVIMDKTDLVWLQSIRLQSSTIQSQSATCPQCGAGIIEANTNGTAEGIDRYCEECGWPDENRPK